MIRRDYDVGWDSGQAMNGVARLLAVGPADFTQQVARALPACEVAVAGSALGGLWAAGADVYDAVVVSAALGPRVRRLIESLRQVRPALRIVAAVHTADEPHAGELIDAGASEYVLEPVERAELEGALGRVRLPVEDDESSPPTHAEVVQLGEILRGLPDGTRATLDRLAALVRDACGAEGVAIEIDDDVVQVGRVDALVLAEQIHRGEAVVGRIALGRRQRGAYGGAHTARLATYTQLVETIIAQVRERDHWRDLAHRDELTGARNTRFFEQRFDEILSAAGAARRCVSVVLADVDELRVYNERHGRDAGDVVLREITELLTRCTREHDLVARVGGDEFAVVLGGDEQARLAGSSHPASGARFGERFARMLETGRFTRLGPDARERVGVMLGLATFPWDGRTREELLAVAADRLEAARRGRCATALTGGPAQLGGAPSAGSEA